MTQAGIKTQWKLSLLHQRKAPQSLRVAFDDVANMTTEWADEASAFSQLTLPD